MSMVAMMFKWLALSFFSFFISAAKPAALSGAVHPFYVSVTEINHNAKEKDLEISCKIFADDLEATLEQQNKTTIDFSNEKQKAQIDGFIKAYIQKHLQLKADGKAVALNYVGFEKESEAVYCYFEGSNVASVKQLFVDNSILQDYTDKQINIVHIIVNGKRQSTKLDAAKETASFSF